MADAKVKAPTYIHISTISIETLRKISASNANAGRTQKKTSETAWGQTLMYCYDHEVLSTADTTQSLDDLAEHVRDGFKKAFLSDIAVGIHELPEGQVRNARTGKEMDLLDPKKDEAIDAIKWSSWDQTRLAINYAKDIAKVLKAEILDEVIVKTDKGHKVMSKNDALKRSGGGETPAQTIERSLKLIGDKFAALKPSEMEGILAMLELNLTTCQDAHHAIKDAMESAK